MNRKISVHVVLSGRVQGVFFRMETRQAAERFGVNGWVRNRADGTVEAVFEGESEKVDLAVDWCKKGPPMASVSNIKIDEIEYTGDYMDFSIRS
ncbi:MAG: acylphosphatase [Desulfobacterales bacterium]|nr:acylphosphatase [Desulfobacterales bacterium]